MMRFNRQFMFAFAATALVVMAPLAIRTMIASKELPPKPHLPIPGREFVADYGGVASDVAHFIFYHGLFGIGRNVERADLLLLGTSHMQFGISARQLSERLTRDAGRPVVAFNLGLGCSEHAGFGARTLDHLDISNKPAIVDTFLLWRDNTTGCSRAAVNAGKLDAGFHVATVWFKFLWDWSVDGLLPTVVLNDGNAPALSRYLFRYVVFDDWEFGGATYFYRAGNEVFPNSRVTLPVRDGSADDLPWDLTAGTIAYESTVSSLLHPRHIALTYTLLPFPKGSAPDRQSYELIAKLLSESKGKPQGTAQGSPFLPIDAADLSTFDGSHLTGMSARTATDRLADQIAARSQQVRPAH